MALYLFGGLNARRWVRQKIDSFIDTLRSL